MLTLNNKVVKAVGLLDLQRSGHLLCTPHTENTDEMLLKRRRWRQAQSHGGVFCTAKASAVGRLPSGRCCALVSPDRRFRKDGLMEREAEP